MVLGIVLGRQLSYPLYHECLDLKLFLIIVKKKKKKSILPVILQHAQFLCFLGRVVKGAAGTCIALDVYLPPTFFFLLLQEKKISSLF